MPKAYQISVGDKYNRLTVISEPYTKREGKRLRAVRVVNCRCDCGEVSAGVRVNWLISGYTKSCGCFCRETTAARNFKHGSAPRTKREPLYKIWQSMRRRCLHSYATAYRWYGGRGITICDEWRSSFPAFREWAVSNGYKPGLEIDRIDSDGNYEPANCRWLTRRQQMWNCRTNHRVTAFGETKCVAEWTEDQRCVVSYGTLIQRVRSGWAGERAISTPSLKYA